MIGAEELSEILPQKPPFIMIDKVIAFEKDKSLTAIKNITGNEWVFDDQAFETDIFPETLVIEAAAQAAVIFYKLSKVDDKNLIILAKTTAEFFTQAKIGNQLRFTVGAHKLMHNQGYVDIEAQEGNTKIADINIFYSIQKKG